MQVHGLALSIVALTLTAPLPAQEISLRGQTLEIQHDPIGCFVAGLHPLISAQVDPGVSVARARVYYNLAASDDFHFVEMQCSRSTGACEARLPKALAAGEPYTYYILATTAAFVEGRTPERKVRVVNSADECPGDLTVAATGSEGPVEVYPEWPIETGFVAATDRIAGTAQRFGVTVGLSGAGVGSWVWGAGASAWVRVLGPVNFTVDAGHYDEESHGERQHHRLLSGGVGVRRRNGGAHPFAHVLLGKLRDRREPQGPSPSVHEESYRTTLIGVGCDFDLSFLEFRVSLEYLRATSDRASTMRFSVGVGYSAPRPFHPVLAQLQRRVVDTEPLRPCSCPGFSF